MLKSETINELATALAKAQMQMKPAGMNADNPFFHSKYADLAAVWEACRKPLSDNGLSVVQGVECDTERYLETMLLHSSGQWISSRINLTVKDNTMQGIGSAITYARRYSLSAMVGICPDDDDDGNAASLPDKQVAKPKPVPAPQATPPTNTAPQKERWCSLHETAFFKKGKMKAFAHPIGDTGDWCHEHIPDAPEAKTTAETKKPVATEAYEPKSLKNVGEFLTACNQRWGLIRSEVEDKLNKSTIQLGDLADEWKAIKEIMEGTK